MFLVQSDIVVSPAFDPAYVELSVVKYLGRFLEHEFPVFEHWFTWFVYDIASIINQVAIRIYRVFI